MLNKPLHMACLFVRLSRAASEMTQSRSTARTWGLYVQAVGSFGPQTMSSFPDVHVAGLTLELLCGRVIRYSVTATGGWKQRKHCCPC